MTSTISSELAVSVLKSAGDAIVTLDRSAKVTSWNLAAERLFGFSEQDAIEQGLVLIIPAEHRARHVAGFHAAMDSGHLEHGGAVARVEAMTASGQKLVLGMTLGLLQREGQEPSGVVAVLRPLGDAAVEFVTG